MVSFFVFAANQIGLRLHWKKMSRLLLGYTLEGKCRD